MIALLCLELAIGDLCSGVYIGVRLDDLAWLAMRDPRQTATTAARLPDASIHLMPVARETRMARVPAAANPHRRLSAHSVYFVLITCHLPLVSLSSEALTRLGAQSRRPPAVSSIKVHVRLGTGQATECEPGRWHGFSSGQMVSADYAKGTTVAHSCWCLVAIYHHSPRRAT